MQPTINSHTPNTSNTSAMTQAEVAAFLSGKRIAAVDYGLRRVGFAVCDELHIVVSPRGFFENHPPVVGKRVQRQQPVDELSAKEPSASLPINPHERLWKELLPALERERVSAVVVGVPYRTDGLSTALIEHIHRFCHELRVRTRLPVFEIDESFSSNRAVHIMASTGASRKKRARKGNTDAVAAALLLRDFLEEYGG